MDGEARSQGRGCMPVVSKHEQPVHNGTKNYIHKMHTLQAVDVEARTTELRSSGCHRTGSESANMRQD